MMRKWAQEAGVQTWDTEAMQDLLERKLASGEFGKFIIERD